MSGSNRNNLYLMGLLLLGLFFVGCAKRDASVASEKKQPLRQPEGRWTATLESPGGPLEFEIDIREEDGGLCAEVVNGEERIPVDELSIEEDQIKIGFPHYDSQILATMESSTEMTGTWTKLTGPNQREEMVFKATRGLRSYSTTHFQKFVGRYDVRFDSSEDPAVGVFQTKNGRVDGTFLTTTGDYRFLAGSYHGDRRELKLTCFDGGHAFLFKATVQEDESLSGDFWSRGNWHETWTATKNETATVADGFEQVSWKDHSLGEIQFPDLAGKKLALNDASFQGKLKIIQVFGSWCPNCHDASVFLNELHQEYRERGLSVIGLAFELTGDFERDVKQLERYKSRTGATYPILLAGIADKAKATKRLKILSRVKSYPTSIFLDENDRPIAIHSGFAGPATGQAHLDLKNRFREIISKQLSR